MKPSEPIDEPLSLLELFYRLAPRCGLDQMVDSEDFREILRALDAHHDATQAQIAALEKRVAELEKANEKLKWTVGVKTIGAQGPYLGPRNGGGFGEF